MPNNMEAFMKLYNPGANENNTLEVYAKDTDCCGSRDETACEYHAAPTATELPSFKAITVEVDGSNKTIAFDASTPVGDERALRDAIRKALRGEGYATKHIREAIESYYDEGDGEVDVRVRSSLKLVSLTLDNDSTTAFTQLCDLSPIHKFEFVIPGDNTAVAIAVKNPDGTDQETYSIDADQSVESTADVDGELQTNLTTVYEAEVVKNSDDNFEVTLWVYDPFGLEIDAVAKDILESDQVYVDAATVPQP